jgi:hypothetical protein
MRLTIGIALANAGLVLLLAKAITALPPVPTLTMGFLVLVIGDLLLFRLGRSVRSQNRKGETEIQVSGWKIGGLLLTALAYLAGACYGLLKAENAGWEWNYCLGTGVSIIVASFCLSLAVGRFR